MKMLKENANGFIVCLFEIVVGILLLVNPLGFTSGIIITAGILLCLSGLKSVIKYFRTETSEAVKSQLLFKGAVFLITGLFCAVKSDWFVATFPLLTVLYGIIILLAALIKLQNTVNMIRLKRKKWYISAIGAVASAVCSVIIMFNPFSSTAVLWLFTGITLVVEAFVDIVALLINGKESDAGYAQN